MAAERRIARIYVLETTSEGELRSAAGDACRQVAPPGEYLVRPYSVLLEDGDGRAFRMVQIRSKEPIADEDAREWYGALGTALKGSLDEGVLGVRGASEGLGFMDTLSESDEFEEDMRNL